MPYTWISGTAGSQDNYPLAIIPYHLGGKIHIDNSGINAPNWSRTAELNFWLSGSGIASDPYVISGLKIDAEGFGSGIYIENSLYPYFVISNLPSLILSRRS